ncbi:MAG: hypothetical protein Q7T54_03225 [Candidatus Levybacteria bacterium]|nr:hypothetical protein [Candidatus Levybacteria bacterium]
MTKKNSFNTVTPLSKAIAFFLFVTLPFVGFYFGMQYQKELDKPFMQEVVRSPEVKMPEGIACTMDAKICPDGSNVGRRGPDCEFEKCPGE